MIERITDGILAAISEAFEGCTIYTERVEQGLNKPCFFVTCINPNIRLYRGRRYLHTNQYAIQYLTDAVEPRAECAAVAERLFRCVELISVDGDLMRGTGMSAEVTEEAMTFTVNYDFFSYRPKDDPKMEDFEGTETALKG